jgi:cell division transport system permease protein
MILNTTWHHIRRSPFQSLTAILVLWLTFFFGSLFTFTTDGLNNVLTHLETKPEITIFLKDGLDKTTVETIQAELAAYPSIKEIKFISKDKALDIFKDQNQNNPLLLQMVTASVLPASFEVAVTDPKVLSQIAENFTPKTNIVDEIIYQKDIIKSLLSWTNIIRQTGLFTTIALSSIAFLLIFAIIGMKITNRKEEVNISRLWAPQKVCQITFPA